MALYKDSEYCSGDGSNLGMPAQRRVRFSKATGEALNDGFHSESDGEMHWSKLVILADPQLLTSSFMLVILLVILGWEVWSVKT